MKLSMFHLMPYQDLPEDFETNSRSAWVDYPNENINPETRKKRWKPIWSDGDAGSHWQVHMAHS